MIQGHLKIVRIFLSGDVKLVGIARTTSALDVHAKVGDATLGESFFNTKFGLRRDNQKRVC